MPGVVGPEAKPKHYLRLLAGKVMCMASLHHHFVHDILVGIMLQHMSQLEGHSNFHDAITAHLSALHVVLVRGRRLR